MEKKEEYAVEWIDSIAKSSRENKRKEGKKTIKRWREGHTVDVTERERE